jgi:hypothetical protein
MWPRVVEVMIGVWLAMSPFIFHPSFEHPPYWWSDFACSVLVMTFALLSFWHPTRKAHLLQIVMGLWLMAWAYANGFVREPVPPSLQNNVMTGFTLLMFAILPNRASRPTASWENLLLERAQRGTEKRDTGRSLA